MDRSANRFAPRANSSDGPPVLKRQHCAFDDSSATDGKPKIRKINEIFAVELLEMVVRCIPTKPTEKVWRHAELSEITITRQFQLRYLCRLWRSILYRNTKLSVVLTCADGSVTREISVHPAGFRFQQAAGLFEALVCSAKQSATLDGGSWIKLITRVRLNWNGEMNDESTIAVLTRLTKSVRHPISLDLGLPTANMIGTIKHNFRIPFVTRFPNLTLAKLDLWSACHSGLFVRMEFIYSARLMNFYLNSASNHLTELHVGLFVLDKALTGFSKQRNSVRETEPWTCHSLRLLKLWIAPLDIVNYDGNNAETRNAAFAIQAKLPTWFPQLKQLQLDWSFNRFQFDFTVLQNFGVLDDLSLLGNFAKRLVCRGYRLASLPNITTFAFSGYGIFPMDLSVFVPNVCHLGIFSLDGMTCRDLTRQLTANANVLQNLRTLSLDGHPRLEVDLYPTPNDVRHLLQALEGAPHLTELELKNVFPDHLSLFNNIPKGVVKLTLDCCLMPDWVGYDCEYEKWFVYGKRATLCELNETYEKWIVDLLCRLADFPALKEFRCVAPTPNFPTTRNLLAQWRRNISGLVADLRSYSLQGKNLDPISLQSIDLDPVDTSATTVGLTAKLLASGDTPTSVRRIIARIVFKNAIWVRY